MSEVTNGAPADELTGALTRLLTDHFAKRGEAVPDGAFAFDRMRSAMLFILYMASAPPVYGDELIVSKALADSPLTLFATAEHVTTAAWRNSMGLSATCDA